MATEILGVGTHIVECLRVAKLIQRHEDTFLRRVFTPHEIEFCSSRGLASQSYAGRWAAKEAVLKSLGGWVRGISWQNVEVRSEAGQLRVLLSGGAKELSEKRRATRILLSISQCRTHAVAYALACRRESPGDEELPF